MVKKKEDNDVFLKIHENYNYMNKMMVEEMDIASKHDGITGNYREEMWIKFFRSIIPKKFSMAQGVMLIDSKGAVSKEVDIAVFDEQYTPYVFQYNTLKFIPIEAVAIVIECKSTGFKDNALKEWSERIDDLLPCRSGISRMVTGYTIGITNQTQVRSRPIKILASLKKNKEEKALEDLKNRLGDHFDFIIQEKSKDFQIKKFEVLVKNDDKTLGWWGNHLNGTELKDKLLLQHIFGEKAVEIREELNKCSELEFDEDYYLINTLKDLEIDDNPLLSLNLQLNQLLMLLNNPMLFPHFAYAETFKKIIRKTKEEPSQKSE